MTWSLTRIIWFREVRDLLRDRRTLLMIVVLPAVLYPIMGLVGFLFALSSEEKTSIIGLYGIDHLPKLTSASAGLSPVPAATLFALTPNCDGMASVIGTSALEKAVRASQDYPPLVIDDRFPQPICSSARVEKATRVIAMPDASLLPLETRQIDVLLVVPANLCRQLDAGAQPEFQLYSRRGDESSKLAERRLRGILGRWKKGVQQVRLARRGLPADFDDPVAIRTPDRESEPLKQATEELSDLMARFFPFMLIMWSMAGALYPAIDVCAGEKERGTLETLLLSPAARSDIVCGKFLAVWVFSAATALWNLAWMGGGAWLAQTWLPLPILRLGSLVWCVILTMLLAALFSAVSLALGVYAKSTKEGQYYLLPLFLVTLPLTFLPLLPGVELNWIYSLVPVTGATLLLQRLMLDAPGPLPWVYFFPVLLSLAVSIALALRWAASQFQREEVLFREAERLRLGQWLRRATSRDR